MSLDASLASHVGITIQDSNEAISEAMGEEEPEIRPSDQLGTNKEPRLKQHRCAHALCLRDGSAQTTIPAAGIRLSKRTNVTRVATMEERETNLRRLERDEEWIVRNLKTKRVRICNSYQTARR